MKIASGVWVVLLVVLLFVAIFQGLWVDEAIVHRTLDKHGYSNVKIIKINRYFVGLRGCGGGDAAKFTVKAKNPVGKEVEVFVCAGWLFKGATIRSD